MVDIRLSLPAPVATYLQVQAASRYMPTRAYVRGLLVEFYRKAQT